MEQDRQARPHERFHVEGEILVQELRHHVNGIVHQDGERLGIVPLLVGNIEGIEHGRYLRAHAGLDVDEPLSVREFLPSGDLLGNRAVRFDQHHRRSRVASDVVMKKPLDELGLTRARSAHYIGVPLPILLRDRKHPVAFKKKPRNRWVLRSKKRQIAAHIRRKIFAKRFFCALFLLMVREGFGIFFVGEPLEGKTEKAKLFRVFDRRRIAPKPVFDLGGGRLVGLSGDGRCLVHPLKFAKGRKPTEAGNLVSQV